MRKIKDVGQACPDQASRGTGFGSLLYIDIAARKRASSATPVVPTTRPLPRVLLLAARTSPRETRPRARQDLTRHPQG
eukprot:3660313-Amphidinium_carterae.1